ncbi:MAG: D-2-hydroxyacid dehydrogenase [Thaumarchaeota archaeon]|nr:D-2-hydroxyacid dehydrogenase [Nitrososphaerota archaeon]MCY3976034.1 D-2-hydroxyacid dehydrogenase [Nitrososphaerota archaeon]
MSFSKHVLICDPVDPILNKILQDNGFKIRYSPTITNKELELIIHDFDILIIRSRTKLTKKLIEKAHKCSIIARVGVGLDNIDLEAADKKNIDVINSAESASTAVAELVLCLLLSLSRQIIKADGSIRQNKWLKKELLGSELKGKYLGIIGLGNVGKRLSRLARGLNMNIIGYDINSIDDTYAREVGLIKTDFNTLLKSCDYISLHVPLMNSTYHMINQQKLSMMKKTAFLINTSRGGIIDEEALYLAIKNGDLAGAALDVFENEPISQTKLTELPNVILTPHIGAQTQEAQLLAANVIAEKIIHRIKTK